MIFDPFNLTYWSTTSVAIQPNLSLGRGHVNVIAGLTGIDECGVIKPGSVAYPFKHSL